MFDGFNKDGTGVNLDHNHDVVITGLGVVGKFSGLVGKDGVVCVIHFGEDVALLVALELWRLKLIQWDGFGLGGAYILSGLVEVTLWSFNCFGIKHLHIMRSEEWPTNKVPCLDCREPCSFTGWLHTACIYLIDCSVEGRSYVLLVQQRVWHAFLDGA